VGAIEVSANQLSPPPLLVTRSMKEMRALLMNPPMPVMLRYNASPMLRISPGIWS
jgi:hypothetical protein